MHTLYNSHPDQVITIIVNNHRIMDLHLSLTIATFSVILLIFLFQILFQKRAKISQNQNPPQAKGAWPIIGHLHLLGGSVLPHRIFSDLADTYGPVFTIKLGVRQALVVSDAEMAKQCFTTNDKAFASRPTSLLSVIMGYDYAMFALSPYGEYWRQVRKLATVELLSQRRVEMLKHVRVSEVRTFMKDTYEAFLRNKEVEDSDTVKVEMREFFANLVFNIITRTIAGKRFSPGDEEAVEIHTVVKKFFEFLGTFVVSDFIPSLKFMDLGGHVKRMKLVAKEMDDIIERWLNEHKQRRESNEVKQDFMDILISIVEAASKDEFPGYDRDTVIRSTSLVIITAGFDSTAVTLTWAIVLLLNNPETLKRAQEELDLHVGRKRLVDESDIKNLVYLQAIIKETLRLYPPAPISLLHQSTEDCVVGGYTVPKDTLLIANLWKLHRDPNVWSDPYKFRPERFLTDKKDIDLKGQHYELLPFGSGRRMCPGVSFALQSLHLTLASLIQGFELAKSSDGPVDTSDIFRLTNNKASPLDVLLRPRLSSDVYRVDA
ncbi:putative cytochrome P450 [Helianthus annuus]|uniref:Cytochrome P450 n=2 Tax=Helianthus annuus TaxID=4232 RepID=A0A251TZN9_HELAN|nr:putative cytochrome P450 [Helianthus annuus]KAJ0527343.1 putative cytochrome P450 [Helianthus annuus]KAJ0536029.1 putative cytochrome P450 [Helianthus annuus]KAJ0543745.1 putative cytochrome P450 [Helianthus annuus]KAJ0708799.1 putative cytochrome P450 [Helianthus annuus]